MTNPKLLILDEATSSLDAQTESEIVEEVNNLKTEMTIVVVAHRLSTIKNADQIIYLSNGKIDNVYPNQGWSYTTGIHV